MVVFCTVYYQNESHLHSELYAILQIHQKLILTSEMHNLIHSYKALTEQSLAPLPFRLLRYLQSYIFSPLLTRHRRSVLCSMMDAICKFSSFASHTAWQHVVCRVMQTLHMKNIQTHIIEVSICRRLHMDTSMICVCIFFICRVCVTLYTTLCHSVSVNSNSRTHFFHDHLISLLY